MLLVEFEDVLQGPDNELKNIFRALLVLGQLQVLSQHCETLVNLLLNASSAFVAISRMNCHELAHFCCEEPAEFNENTRR